MRGLLGVFFLFVGLMEVQAGTNLPCEDQLGSCAYYSCRESIQHCGSKGYFDQFAIPYCAKFSQLNEPDISHQGKEWILRVGQCLRDSLASFPMTKESDSCELTKNFAFQSHEDCYVSTGFCDLVFSDQWEVFKIVFKEIAHRDSRTVFFEIAKRCNFRLE